MLSLLLLSSLLPIALTLPQTPPQTTESCPVTFIIPVFENPNCYIPAQICTSAAQCPPPGISGYLSSSLNILTAFPQQGTTCLSSTAGGSGASFTVAFLGENCEPATGAAGTGASIVWWSGDNCDGDALGSTGDLGEQYALPCFGAGGGPFGSLQVIGYQSD